MGPLLTFCLQESLQMHIHFGDNGFIFFIDISWAIFHYLYDNLIFCKLLTEEVHLQEPWEIFLQGQQAKTMPPHFPD